jgi:hypothetical protein
LGRFQVSYPSSARRRPLSSSSRCNFCFALSLNVRVHNFVPLLQSPRKSLVLDLVREALRRIVDEQTCRPSEQVILFPGVRYGNRSVGSSLTLHTQRNIIVTSRCKANSTAPLLTRPSNRRHRRPARFVSVRLRQFISLLSQNQYYHCLGSQLNSGLVFFIPSLL